MKNIIKKSLLFIIIGLTYILCEYIFRGHSHISMFILAGICGVFFIDTPNNIYTFELDYGLQVLISAILCTFGEGVTGIIVNRWLNLHVWDYSSLSFGTFFWGQCNVFFVAVWALLIGFIGIPLCDAYNYYICKEEPRPYYKIRENVIFKFPIRK